MKPAHLYVHVPFCARRCSYCDFAVHARRRPPVEAWLSAIVAELRAAVAAADWDPPLELDTVYVGGGTPSLLGPDALPELRRRLEPWARWGDDTEWTAEANPESFDAELAADWRAAGVNRVSLGVQTFHEPALRWLGRLHGPDGPGRAIDAARGAGIDNVSVDLIFGLPERLERPWRADVERALALEPSHVSLYGLTAEPGTPLGRRVREGGERMPDEERYEDEYLWVAERLPAAGFDHYEVSNFARSGRESRHNGAYWSGAAYLGLGPSAHSFLPPVRRWNLRHWPGYRDAVEAGRRATEAEERVEGDDARLERIWLSLRTREGLPAAALAPAQRELAVRWRARGWARAARDAVRLTPRGWLLLDRLALELDAAVGGERLDGGLRESSHFLQHTT